MGGSLFSAANVRLALCNQSRLPAFSARFASDDRGVTAIIFGIMFALLFLVAAAAVDYSRANREYMEEQQALDAAVLAASQDLGVPDQDTAAQARAMKFFAANMPANSTANVTVTLDNIAGEVNGTASNAMSTTLFGVNALGEAKRDHINFNTRSRVVKGNGTIEIALVVDNSGSMSGTKIADLKTAATNLVSVVFTGAEGDKVKVGVVPFSGSVNVGSMYAEADWMDTEAESSTHSENFSETKSRFTLFDELGETWGGCVEARPTPYDVTDATPASGTPDTKFVPMFAPDEPDDTNADAAGYYELLQQLYLRLRRDVPRTRTDLCRPSTGKRTRAPRMPRRRSALRRRSRGSASTQARSPGSDTGPNFGCSTPAILPLTQIENLSRCRNHFSCRQRKHEYRRGHHVGLACPLPVVPVHRRPCLQRHGKSEDSRHHDGRRQYVLGSLEP